MPKDDLVYVGHMLDTAKKALEKVQNKDRSAYDADENLRMALVHLIQVLGEAARRVSQDFQDVHAAIPWKQIIGMRHKVVRLPARGLRYRLGRDDGALAAVDSGIGEDRCTVERRSDSRHPMA